LAVSCSLSPPGRTRTGAALTPVSNAVGSGLLHVGVWEKEVKARFNRAEVKGRIPVYFSGM